jgi:hypothetical protein
MPPSAALCRMILSTNSSGLPINSARHDRAERRNSLASSPATRVPTGPTSRTRSWLAALDNFRNWLIRRAA